MKHLFRKYLKVLLLFSNLNTCMGTETSLFSNLPTEIVEHIGEYVAGPISKDGAINLTDWNALYQTSKKNCKSLQGQEKKYINAKAQKYTTKAFKFYRKILNIYLYSPNEDQREDLYCMNNLRFAKLFNFPDYFEPVYYDKSETDRILFPVQEKIKNILEVFLVRSAGTMYCRYPEIKKYPTYRYTIHFYKVIQSILEDDSSKHSKLFISYPSMNYTDKKVQTINQSKNFGQMYVSGLFGEFNYKSFIRLSIESPSFIPELKEENSEKNKEFILNIRKILQDFKSHGRNILEIVRTFEVKSVRAFYSAWMPNWKNNYELYNLSEVSGYKEVIKILNLENDTFLEDLEKLSEHGKKLNENKGKIQAIFPNLNDKIQSLETGWDEYSEFKEILKTIKEKSRVRGMTTIMEEKYKYDLLKSKILTVIRSKIKRIYNEVEEFCDSLEKIKTLEKNILSALKIPSTSSIELSQMAERVIKLNQECANLNFDLKIFDGRNQIPPYTINWQSPEFKRFMDFYNGPYLLKKNTIAQEEKMIMEDFEQYCANNSPDDSGSDSDSDESKSVSAQEPSVKKQKFNP